MNDIDQVEANVAAVQDRGRNPLQWADGRFARFLAGAIAVGGIGGVVLLALEGHRVLSFFHFLQDNLPLTLPILTVAMSIMLRPHELKELRGWLGLCNYFALGLVTFAIWAFVAGQSVSQYIAINKSEVMNKDYSLLLVFGSFIWASFCSVVTALATITSAKERKGWQVLQVLLVAISIALMISPFYLFEKKVDVQQRTGVMLDEKRFAVSIPYRDPAYDTHLGRSANPMTQCKVYRGIAATTKDIAIAKARSQFEQSPEYKQYVPPNRVTESRPVEILDNLIVASAD